MSFFCPVPPGLGGEDKLLETYWLLPPPRVACIYTVSASAVGSVYIIQTCQRRSRDDFILCKTQHVARDLTVLLLGTPFPFITLYQHVT
jgi:hypothetical protein